MHFIPNPNNTEFIYLLGLEAVVDRLTQGADHPTPPIPFICSQCGTDFSSLWKWDKAATRKLIMVGQKTGDGWLMDILLNSRETSCNVRPVRDQ